MVSDAVQSAMPSAQNLVLLMQLRKSTQPLAPRMAALLLRIYAVAVIPVTAWITVFKHAGTAVVRCFLVSDVSARPEPY